MKQTRQSLLREGRENIKNPNYSASLCLSPFELLQPIQCARWFSKSHFNHYVCLLGQAPDEKLLHGKWRLGTGRLCLNSMLSLNEYTQNKKQPKPSVPRRSKSRCHGDLVLSFINHVCRIIQLLQHMPAVLLKGS